MLAEMYLGKPLFEGCSEYDQLIKICSVLGVPKDAEWPGVSALPRYAGVQEACRTTCLEQVIGNTELVGILSEMLVLNPRERLSARASLDHSFFASTD